MDRIFTAEDTWTNGMFGLGLELRSCSDERLLQAVTAIWEHEFLDGCYLDMKREPSEQSRLHPVHDSLSVDEALYGVGTFAESAQIPCFTYSYRTELGRDWLYLYTPMHAIDSLFETGAYPFGTLDYEPPVAWQEPVCQWFRSIAAATFEVAPFEFGLIGWEIDDDDICARDVERRGIPTDSTRGYLWPEAGKLKWSPPSGGAVSVFLPDPLVHHSGKKPWWKFW